jgi:hypothetical protein
MAPAESSPSPRTITMGEPIERANPDKLAGPNTIARALDDAQSETGANSPRASVAADTQPSSPATPGPAVPSRPTRVWVPDPSLHHIVIVGGGAAGLELAT